MAGNPYGGIAENAFISNLFASRINEKLRRKQEEQQADELARQIDQQQFMNKMAQEEARQRQETLLFNREQLADQRDYTRDRNAFTDYQSVVEASGKPNITPGAYNAYSGAFAQQYPQFEGNIPARELPQPQPLTAQQILEKAASYLPQGSGPANAFLSQAGYEGTMPQPQPPIQGNIPLQGLIPNWPGPAPGIPFNLPQPDKQVPFQFPQTVNEGREGRMGTKDKFTFAKDMILGALSNNRSAENWNTLLPLVNARVAQVYGEPLTSEQIQTIKGGIPELAPGYQQVATEAGTQLKQEAQELKLAQFAWKKQMDVADQSLKVSREQRIKAERSVTGLGGVGGKQPTALQMQNLDDKYSKEANKVRDAISATKTSIANVRGMSNEDFKEKSPGVSKEQIIAGLNDKLIQLGSDLQSLSTKREQLRPFTMLKDAVAPTPGGNQDMSYGAVAKRWAHKNDKQVVSDTNIQKLVNGTKAAKPLIKDGKLSASDYGKAFRIDAKKYGYTSTEADRLFKIFMTQL